MAGGHASSRLASGQAKMAECVLTTPSSTTPAKLSAGVYPSHVTPFISEQVQCTVAGNTWCPSTEKSSVLMTLNTTSCHIMWYNSGFYWILNRLTAGGSTVDIGRNMGSDDHLLHIYISLESDGSLKQRVTYHYNKGTTPSAGYTYTVYTPGMLVIIN